VSGETSSQVDFGGFSVSSDPWTAFRNINRRSHPYGNSEPFGTASATDERTFTVFINYSQAHPGLTAPGDYDIGMFTLNGTIGNATGWMSYGYDHNNADFAPGTIYNTAGYPVVPLPGGGWLYDGHRMESSSGAIAGLSPDGMWVRTRAAAPRRMFA
jgi:hypothetical protein